MQSRRADGASSPGSEGLAIPGYDSLAASQVVQRLAGLAADELAAVGAYESAHRGRRTILTRVAPTAGSAERPAPVEQARVATAADIPALKTLWEMAVRELDGQRGGALLARQHRPARRLPAEALARRPRRRRPAGRAGNHRWSGGGLRLGPVRPGAADHPIGVIEAVYVEPSARQVGVGEAIVDLVVSWCRERGCGGVDAPALPGSRPAKAFFEDHGFVARLLVMHHPLPGPATGRRWLSAARAVRGRRRGRRTSRSC